jgi:transposase
MEHCGIDLHSKSSEVAVINEAGKIEEQVRISTTESSLRRWFGGRKPMVICLEAGGQSAWAMRILTSLGHDVVVANPGRVRLIAEATLKNDKVDAITLARLVRADRQLLCPIIHRSAETQRQRGVLRVRRTLMNARTACLNASRGILRSFGYRTPGRKAERLAERLADASIPEEMVSVVAPLVQLALELDEKIAALDEAVETMGHAYPEVALLRTVPGVGPLVALSFVLCIENPQRFARSRDLAGYLGLRPKMRESASTSHYGGITHQGDIEMRSLLVQAAHGLLRSRADSDLKRWANGLAERIGKNKAVVALARKLAVVMHTMWVRGEPFRPFRKADDLAAAA